MPDMPDRRNPNPDIVNLRELGDKRHGENLARFEAIETHLDKIYQQMKIDVDQHKIISDQVKTLTKDMRDSQEDRRAIRHDLETNTGVTNKTQETVNSIKKDTETIVNIAKAAATFKRFLIWFLPLAASAISVYVTWKTIKP